MATIKIPNTDNTQDLEKITIVFDNGDLEAMKTIQNEWEFLDEPSLLRFAIAVLRRAKNKKVYVEDEVGNKINIFPGEQLLKQKPTTTNQNINE
jgi:hypothetical protein